MPYFLGDLEPDHTLEPRKVLAIILAKIVRFCASGCSERQIRGFEWLEAAEHETTALGALSCEVLNPNPKIS